MGFGLVLALSAYFIYINYITNPEFYKSLKQSREASKRDSQQQTATSLPLLSLTKFHPSVFDPFPFA
jgi:hypothetical protein